MRTISKLRLCFGFAVVMLLTVAAPNYLRTFVFCPVTNPQHFIQQTKPWSFGTSLVTNSTTASPRNVCTDIHTSSATSFFLQMVTTHFPVLGTRLSVYGIWLLDVPLVVLKTTPRFNMSQAFFFTFFFLLYIEALLLGKYLHMSVYASRFVH